MTDPQPAPPNRVGPTPLWAILLLTFLGSLGTGAITNGFSFIATEGLGYERRMNLLMALVLGVTYIGGAMASGPIVAHLSRRSTRMSPRGLLAIVLVVIALVCQLPILAQRLAPGLMEVSLWTLIAVFSPMTGILWPVVEGYLSGGRRDKDLRSALGRFNIVWSGALVVAFWGMAPLLRDHPFVILSLLGGTQLLMCVVLLWFPPYPPRSIDEDTEPVPAVYVSLLTIFRVLLIASYIVLSALSPLLPIVEDRLGVDVHWKTPLASAWLGARVLLFVIFERWHGWHGRWWTPWTGMGLMLLGFGACMISPMFLGWFGDAGTSVGVGVLIAGLIVTGFGVAMTYYGALYYALAVSNTHPDQQVGAGGKHEAMIGMGYTLGPLCGLASYGIAGPGNDDAFRVWVVVLISVCVLVSTLLGWALLRRRRPLSASLAGIDTPLPH